VNVLKFIRLTSRQLIRQIRSVPQAIAVAMKQRRLQAVWNEREAERLDRIRNPSNYLGK
jgi:hypothetical protein